MESEVFEGLEPLSALRALDVSHRYPVDRDAFKRIGKLKQLRSLHATNVSMQPSDLAHLAGLVELRELVVAENNLKDCLGSLDRMTHLETLDISMNELTDADFERLAKHQSLTSLSAVMVKVSDHSLDEITKLGRLRVLKLPWAGLTDKSKKNLSRLETLEELEIEYNDITDAGLVPLKKCSRLQELYVGWTKVTDRGLLELQGLGSLRKLSDCPISGGFHKSQG
jgi:Leucine-rich repeat (LRR) protein